MNGILQSIFIVEQANYRWLSVACIKIGIPLPCTAAQGEDDLGSSLQARHVRVIVRSDTAPTANTRHHQTTKRT